MKDLQLKDNERVKLIVRQYSITHLWKYIIAFLFVTIAFFFMFWFFQHSWWGQSIFVLLIFLSIVIFARTLFFWKNNQLIITSHRVVDIDQRGIFERIVSEIPYDQIEDVSGKIKGIFGTMLKYGTISIQTNEGQVIIMLERIKRPLHLQQLINDQREKYLSQYIHEFGTNVTNAITEKLYELELPDLYKLRSAVEKQIKRLSEK